MSKNEKIKKVRELAKPLKPLSDEVGNKFCPQPKTSEKLATEYNTHPNTVKNYAKDAELYEKYEKEKPEIAKDIWIT